jgi:hypothetical protein
MSIGAASCHHKFNIYQQVFSSTSVVALTALGNQEDFLSTSSMPKSYKDVYEDILSDHQVTQGMMRNDPRALSEWNKRMTGGEKATPEYEEIAERMERGEWPAQQIEEKRKEFTGGEEEKKTGA